MDIEYDKKTGDWFANHRGIEVTVCECPYCGLYYKADLGHDCKNAPAVLPKNAPAVLKEVRISPRTGKPIDEKKNPKRNGRGGNRGGHLKSPMIGMNGYDLKEGDNNKFLQLNMELFALPKINLNEPEEVRQRLSDYFAIQAKHDIKPTVAGMAMVLGMSRQSLLAIVHDYPTGGTGYKTALPNTVTDFIKNAYFLLENLWENYMGAGKLNPVTGIFLGKNNYGYQDKTEYVLTPNQKQDSDYSAEEIRERYLTDNSQT